MSDIFAQIGSKLGSKIKELQAQIDSGGSGGDLSDYATKVSLGTEVTRLDGRIDAINDTGVDLSGHATKVSLASADSALRSLIDLRATTVSLANAESTLTDLIELRASTLGLDSLFKAAQNTYFDDYIFDEAGTLDKIEVWDSDQKNTKLFTKQFNYLGSTINTIVITDHETNAAFTKTFNFVSGTLSSIERAYA